MAIDLLISCDCGRTISLDAWLKLPLVSPRATDGIGGWMELRNCTCGSTKARPLPSTRTSRIRTLMQDEGLSRREAEAEVARYAPEAGDTVPPPGRRPLPRCMPRGEYRVGEAGGAS